MDYLNNNSEKIFENYFISYLLNKAVFVKTLKWNADIGYFYYFVNN